MKFKRTVSLLLAVSAVVCLSSAFAAEPGSREDPLVSKSYVDETYAAEVMSQPKQLLADSVAVLEYKINQISAIQGTSAHLFNVSSGGRITANSGSSFILLSGAAAVYSASGTLIDITDGRTLSTGAALSTGHRYVAAENSIITVSVSLPTKISAQGDVNTTSTTPVSFLDVGKDAWFYSSVTYAVERGIINGRDSGLFDPDGFVTVAEAIKLGACMHQLYYEGGVSLVNGNPWYMSYVEYANQNGIINKTYTDYDAKITRDEFVNIFFSSLPSSEYTPINEIKSGSIPDVEETDPYYDRILSFYRAGIVTGKDSEGSFCPKDRILRSEVSALVERMLEKSTRKSFTIN